MERNRYDGGSAVDDAGGILRIGLGDWVRLGVGVAEERKGLGSRDGCSEQRSDEEHACCPQGISAVYTMGEAMLYQNRR